MLKDLEDGSVLKAVAEPIYGPRELQFYENLRGNLSDPYMRALRNFVLEYRGAVKITFCDKDVNIHCTWIKILLRTVRLTFFQFILNFILFSYLII